MSDTSSIETTSDDTYEESMDGTYLTVNATNIEEAMSGTDLTVNATIASNRPQILKTHAKTTSLVHKSWISGRKIPDEPTPVHSDLTDRDTPDQNLREHSRGGKVEIGDNGLNKSSKITQPEGTPATAATTKSAPTGPGEPFKPVCNMQADHIAKECGNNL